MTSSLTGVLSKVAVGIATAAMLAASAAVIRAAETNAVQEVRITRLERVADRMESLDRNLLETQTEVQLLRKELENRDGK